jgi:septal ring factor EnvC (AmiA/AmiB activator)
MSWPLAEQSRRHVAVPRSKRRTPRGMWAVVLAAFVCGAAVSAAAFSIGWKHQAQKGTSAESALVAATATTHALRMRLATEQSDLAAVNAHAVAIERSRATLRTSLARLRTQLASAQHSLVATSAQAAPLSADLARLTNELHALTSYVTSTPSSQLDAGYLQAQIAYVSKTATKLNSALATLAAPQN